MFHKVKSYVCRNSLSSIFQTISDYYGFNVDKQHCCLEQYFVEEMVQITCAMFGKRTCAESAQAFINDIGCVVQLYGINTLLYY